MLFSSLITLIIALPVFGSSESRQSRSRIRNSQSLSSTFEQGLEKRGTVYSGRATFYDVGMGACGISNVASDYIVALNSNQYGSGYPGPQCGRSITISYNGVQVAATIEDECPTCPYGGLDLSKGLFDRFADENLGVFYMTWWFNDETNDATTSTSETPTYVAPTSSYVAPTSAYTPPTSSYIPPTSTYTPPTSTYVEPSTSSYASTSIYATPSTDSSSELPASSLSSTNSLADAVIQTSVPVSKTTTATAAVSADAALESSVSEVISLGNLVSLNQAVVNLGRILVVGAQE
ncbi:hypothetical protein I306_06014 [Cryptococcus gattii EJB2]|uniref:RlpA-like double-psi beta-barrel-protein domain-containing protein-containing protein n=1 Tax=Cryptococcus gattii EJB2 TaxID=1296103 RepID=A0ABR5BN64_9TREE|nr:hypothetical protein I306_06014 [Cryptococcus gattii EJB2]